MRIALTVLLWWTAAACVLAVLLHRRKTGHWLPCDGCHSDAPDSERTQP